MREKNRHTYFRLKIDLLKRDKRNYNYIILLILYEEKLMELQQQRYCDWFNGFDY